MSFITRYYKMGWKYSVTLQTPWAAIMPSDCFKGQPSSLRGGVDDASTIRDRICDGQNAPAKPGNQIIIEPGFQSVAPFARGHECEAPES